MATITCPQCGSQVPSNSNFCASCGCDLNPAGGMPAPDGGALEPVGGTVEPTRGTPCTADSAPESAGSTAEPTASAPNPAAEKVASPDVTDATRWVGDVDDFGVQYHLGENSNAGHNSAPTPFKIPLNGDPNSLHSLPGNSQVQEQNSEPENLNLKSLGLVVVVSLLAGFVLYFLANNLF